MATVASSKNPLGQNLPEAIDLIQHNEKPSKIINFLLLLYTVFDIQVWRMDATNPKGPVIKSWFYIHFKAGNLGSLDNTLLLVDYS